MLIVHTLQKLLKNDSIKLIISYFLCYFCHIQICNDDYWVICILLSNVKSLFDHVMRRYDIASLGAESESQDLQADTVVYTCRTTPFKHKSGDAHGRIKKPRAPGPGHVKAPPPPFARKRIVRLQNTHAHTNTIRRIYIYRTMCWS